MVSAYPRKDLASYRQALRSYEKLKLSDATCGALLELIAHDARCNEGWGRDDGRWIPSLKKYIEGYGVMVLSGMSPSDAPPPPNLRSSMLDPAQATREYLAARAADTANCNGPSAEQRAKMDALLGIKRKKVALCS